jgi:fatty acid amide hydrolase
MTHLLLESSAASLAAMIQRGEVSSREVVEAHVRRIERDRARINAVVVPLFEQALDAARCADEAQARGEILGPLHGVPITIKESFHVAGTSATMGLTALAGQLSSEDAPLVARLKSAGAIVLGKTNVPQLMLLHETDNPVYGRTNHPRAADRTCGGSSGGEGAIIASGGSPWGLGSDLGGSIRLPAHFCGICGLKPSSQRLTRRGSLGNFRGMDAIQFQPGPMARHVTDLELMLNVLTSDAENSLEPDVVPARLPSSAEVGIRGLRIGFWEDNGYFPYAPAVRRAVREAAQTLADQGAQIEPMTPPNIHTAMELFTAVLSADGSANLRRLLRGSVIDPRIRRMLLLGSLPNITRGLVAGGLAWARQASQGSMVRTARRRSASEYWELNFQVQTFRREVLEHLASTPASASGTSKPFTTTFGTTTWPRLRSWPMSRSTGAPARSSPSRERRDSSTCSIASAASRFGPSSSARSRPAKFPVSGVLRHSRSPPNPLLSRCRVQWTKT